VIGKVPRIGTKTRLPSHALSPDGTLHATLHDLDLTIHEVATGKVTHTGSLKGKVKYPSVFGWSGGWLIGGYGQAFTYDPKTGAGKPFPVREVKFVQEVPGGKHKRLILQDSHGNCSLIDPEKAEVLTQWVAGDGGAGHAPPYDTVLRGGVILRSLGMKGEVDFFDADAARPVLHLHAVTAGEGQVGYVAYTPDGFWDASPGAARRVTLFEDGTLLPEEARDRRRAPETISKRLQALFD
jgi:hypothetical protein